MRPIALLAAFVAALTLPPPAGAVAAADWSWPVRGDVVTRYLNGDDPYAGGQHRGIDIAAPTGADVVAATAGRVTFAGAAGSSGLTVTLRTGDGRLDLSHLHLSAIGVSEGEAVDRGERIGAVGTSGRRSVAQPHLHFGVREAGTDHSYRDPLDFLPPLARPVGEPRAPDAVPQPAPVGAPPATAPAPVADPAAPPAHAPAPLPVGAATTASVALPAAALAGAPAVAARPVARAGSPRVLRSRPLTAGPPRAVGQSAALDERRHGSRDSGGPREAVPGSGRAPASAADRTRPSVPDISPDRPPARTPAGTAVDAGWLAALVGLVAAAACLGRPAGTRRAARSGRAAIAAALRPLVGRG